MKSVSHKAKWFLAIVCVVVFFAGCSPQPPYVDSKEAVLQLPTSTEDITARGLPDDGFAALGHLPQLNDLDFFGGWKNPNANPTFTDAGLATLATLDLSKLDTLYFGHCTNVTDASLVYIIKLKHLTQLGLVACPRITDVGLQTLTTMPNLTQLDLRGCTNITDKGLEILAAKNNWQRLEFGGCLQVSLQAVTNLQQQFPNAKIKKDELEWSYEQ
jgi:hypothetical protein